VRKLPRREEAHRVIESPYDWTEHEPDCRCTDCRKVVPLHKPKPAIPPAVKAELERLKALWRSQRLAEVQAAREQARKLETWQASHARAVERKERDQAEEETGQEEALP
jgi:hypothetical protein